MDLLLLVIMTIIDSYVNFQISDYLRLANELGKALEIPVYSLDRLIMEYLIKNETETARQINSIISTALDEIALEKEFELLPGEGQIIFDNVK